MGKNAKRRRELRAAQARARQDRPDIDLEVSALLDAQLEAFRLKFGRDPGPGDPIFFDPDADTPTPVSVLEMESEMTEIAREAGVDPALIYASQVTGMLLTESNIDQFSDEDIAEWDDAVERYRRLHG